MSMNWKIFHVNWAQILEHGSFNMPGFLWRQLLDWPGPEAVSLRCAEHKCCDCSQATLNPAADRLISCCILQDLCWNALDNVVARKCLDRLIANEVLKYRGEWSSVTQRITASFVAFAFVQLVLYGFMRKRDSADPNVFSLINHIFSPIFSLLKRHPLKYIYILFGKISVPVFFFQFLTPIWHPSPADPRYTDKCCLWYGRGLDHGTWTGPGSGCCLWLSLAVPYKKHG